VNFDAIFIRWYLYLFGLTEKKRVINKAKSNTMKRTEIKHLQALLAHDREIQEQFVLMKLTEHMAQTIIL